MISPSFQLLTGVLLCAGYVIAGQGNQLSPHIQHFEPLEYDTQELHSHHNRARRSTVDNSNVKLDLKAFGRVFRLRLRRDTSAFSSDFGIQNSDGTVTHQEVSHIYSGTVWGEAHSKVHGSIIDGRFQGRIILPSETYHVQSSDYYFAKDPGFPSVIYRDRDVLENPHVEKDENTSPNDEHQHSMGCGNDDVRDWMEQVANSAIVQDTPQDIPTVQTLKRKRRSSPADMYSKESQRLHRRDTSSNQRTTCTLFLQSDTMLWNRMTNKETNRGLGFTEDRAREEIAHLFADHVQGINGIYGDTQFNYPEKGLSFDSISFVVRRIKINESNVDCPQGELTPYNPFCNPNIDVSNFLNLNSLQNHTDFCLSYVFTYRDFTGGTLGLAWVGSPTKASGGICEIYKEYAESQGGRVKKSLNTGIVTLINYNSPVPPKVSTLTFAHEVGHNFGSPHDVGTDCAPLNSSPTNSDGNFIMYASATSGDMPNNSKFSPCSVRNISLVLDAVMHASTKGNGKRNCFVESESKFCGNNIVEDDEECDCGYDGDCQDKCCHGRGYQNDVNLQCKLQNGASCSPSQGPCCQATTCKKITAEDGVECSAETDCTESTNCNGEVATCPEPGHKANGTACNKNTQVCHSGECSGSICERKGWDQCFLTTNEDEDVDKGTLCFVACKDPSKPDGQCISTGDVEALKLPENQALKELLNDLEQEASGIQLPPGAPCNDFRGYCDVFQKCRDVDADGPLARLKKLIFNQETFNDIRDWIIEKWWAVLLMGIGLIIFMGIFIKICAVHTPSSNPRKPKARKIMTLPRQHSRQQGPPPPYPGQNRGGPPHGKGRRGRGQGAAYEMQKV